MAAHRVVIVGGGSAGYALAIAAGLLKELIAGRL